MGALGKWGLREEEYLECCWQFAGVRGVQEAGAEGGEVWGYGDRGGGRLPGEWGHEVSGCWIGEGGTSGEVRRTWKGAL